MKSGQSWENTIKMILRKSLEVLEETSDRKREEPDKVSAADGQVIVKVTNMVFWNAGESILLDCCKGIPRGEMMGLVML